MREPHHDLVGIIGHRVATEARLGALLKQAKSPATVEDIKSLIFSWRHDDRVSTFIAHMLKVCDTPLESAGADEALEIIQDAWNYFPHRSLKGQSPAELFASTIHSARDGGRDMTTIDDDKIDEAVLALLLLGRHDEMRVWKGHDWDALDRLHEKGYISDPARKAKSVILTDEGLREAEGLFNKLFAREPGRYIASS